MSMDIPPMDKERVLQIDATPDGNYALRILTAYLENAQARYVCEPPNPFWDELNHYQALREKELLLAIERLKTL